MFYIVQTNVFQEEKYDSLLETLERMGLEYEVAKFESYKEHQEIRFTTERNDVFCFGAVKMAKVAEKYGWTPGSLMDENSDQEIYGPQYGEHMLNHDSVFLNFSDPLPVDWPEYFFGRPCKDSKAFTGRSFSRSAYEDTQKEAIHPDSVPHIPGDTRVALAKMKQIHQEIRCWVVGGKVVTISQYKLGARVTYKNLDNEDPEAWAFAQQMVDIYQPQRAFCIDICRTEQGFKIVEVNCINCAGFYDANMPKMINALEEHFN